jgi:hypothetical protein
VDDVSETAEVDDGELWRRAAGMRKASASCSIVTVMPFAPIARAVPVHWTA